MASNIASNCSSLESYELDGYSDTVPHCRLRTAWIPWEATHNFHNSCIDSVDCFRSGKRK